MADAPLCRAGLGWVLDRARVALAPPAFHQLSWPLIIMWFMVLAKLKDHGGESWENEGTSYELKYPRMPYLRNCP